jgi:hypothetical protein
VASTRVRGLPDRLLNRSRVRVSTGYRVPERHLSMHPLITERNHAAAGPPSPDPRAKLSSGCRCVTFTDPFGTCKVDVRFKSAAGSPGAHAYIVTTEPDGSRTYFRGGPSKTPNGGSSGTLGGASSDASGSDSDSGNSSSPGSGDGDGDSGLWGRIDTESGSYTRATVDWDCG